MSTFHQEPTFKLRHYLSLSHMELHHHEVDGRGPAFMD